jgi:putative ABC transport system ATP-binding protein
MVLISHDPALAARCDRTVRLVDGRLVDGVHA